MALCTVARGTTGKNPGALAEDLISTVSRTIGELPLVSLNLQPEQAHNEHKAPSRGCSKRLASGINDWTTVGGSIGQEEGQWH